LTSKSFSKRFLSFSNETVLFNYAIRLTSTFLILLFSVSFKTEAVQLENWRLPFFKFASDMEMTTTSSPSAMFWDDIEGAGIFEKSLWPDSSLAFRNHWTLEPAVTSGLYSSAPEEQKSIWHMDLLNDIRYRNFFVRQVLDVDTRYKYDAYYPASKDRGAQGIIGEAYAQLNWKYGFFRLGRLKRNWGPFADRSLILSSNPYAYDAFEWQVHSSFFEFRQLFSAFPYSRSYWDTDNGNSLQRYLAAHSLNVIFGPWATVGITETMLFARKSGFPDLQYINPFSIYTVTNTNQEGSGNLMLAFQWNIHPAIKELSFKGQILIDDIQVDKKIVTDNEPNHWGTDLGIYWRNLVPVDLPNLVKAEYIYRSEWLYTVTDDNGDNGERYTYLSKSIGYPQNDGDRLSAGFQIVGKKYWAAEIDGFFSHQGIRSVKSRWNDSQPGNIPGLPADSAYTMEKTVGISVGGLSYFRNYASVNLKADLAWVRNKDNIPGTRYEFNPSVSAEISLHFSNFRLLLPE
jgi:hypothetical protein